MAKRAYSTPDTLLRDSHVKEWMGLATYRATTRRNSRGWAPVRNTSTMAKSFEEYIRLKNDGNLPQDFEVDEGIIFYVEISQFYPDLNEPMDGKNWHKFQGTFVAERPTVPPSGSAASATSSTASNTGAGGVNTAPVLHVRSGMDRAIEKAVAMTNTFQVEVFKPDVFPDPVIARKTLRSDPKAIIMRSGCTKFKNFLTKNNSGAEQEHKFVRYPLTYNSHIVYCDGTHFKYLKFQDPKVRRQFVKCFPKIAAWNAREWFNFHLTLEARACEHNVWIMPYHLQDPACAHPRGFIVANPEDDVESDLHSDYLECVEPWALQIFEGLSGDDVLPNSDAKSLLKQCHGDGLLFLRQGNLLFNPLLSVSDVSLVSSHPSQGTGSYHDYVEQVEFFYKMQGLVMDTFMDITTIQVQRLFISNM